MRPLQRSIFGSRLGLRVALDDRAADPALPEVERQRQPDRASAHDEDLCVYGVAPDELHVVRPPTSRRGRGPTQIGDLVGRNDARLASDLETREVRLRQSFEIDGAQRRLLNGVGHAHDAVPLQVAHAVRANRLRKLAPELGRDHHARAGPGWHWLLDQRRLDVQDRQNRHAVHAELGCNRLMRVDHREHVRSSSVDLGVNEDLGWRRVLTFDQIAIEIDDHHVGSGHRVHAANPHRVLGLDDDAIGARDAGAGMPQVIRQPESIDDAARCGDQRSQVVFGWHDSDNGAPGHARGQRRQVA